jgi:hypothetical protein
MRKKITVTTIVEVTEQVAKDLDEGRVDIYIGTEDFGSDTFEVEDVE